MFYTQKAQFPHAEKDTSGDSEKKCERRSSTESQNRSSTLQLSQRKYEGGKVNGEFDQNSSASSVASDLQSVNGKQTVSNRFHDRIDRHVDFQQK